MVADFIERIGGVGDELAEEDFFIGIEGVDDQGEELVDVRREGVAFGGGGVGHCSVTHVDLRLCKSSL